VPVSQAAFGNTELGCNLEDVGGKTLSGKTEIGDYSIQRGYLHYKLWQKE